MTWKRICRSIKSLKYFSAAGTPTTVKDCIYTVTPEDLPNLPKTFEDGTKAEKNPDGTVTFTFPADEEEPRDVTDVKVQQPDGSPVLSASPETKDGAPAEEFPLEETSPDSPASNEVVVEDVSSVTIKGPDGGALKPEDFTSIEVVACEEGKSSVYLSFFKICQTDI